MYEIRTAEVNEIIFILYYVLCIVFYVSGNFVQSSGIQREYSNPAQIRYCYLPLGLYFMYCVGLYSIYLHEVEKGEPMYSRL